MNSKNQSMKNADFFTAAAQPILCPVQTVYDITPCAPAEVAPLIRYLESGAVTDEAVTFPRGTILPDGRLDLCKQSLGAGNCQTITRALARSTHIKSLLLGTDGIGDTGARDVSELVGCNSALETVYLGCNRITGAGAAPLCAALAENTSVTGLWLKRNPLGLGGARHVAALLRTNRTVRTLDLVNTNLGPEGIALVLDALIEENRSVERLYLGGNGLGPESAARLAALLRTNPVIKALLLNVSPLGDAGIKEIAGAVGENQTLAELGLASCGVGAEGGQELFAALRHHPAVRHLDLGYSPSTRVLGAAGNHLGDRGAYALADLLAHDTPLARLDLRRNQVGRPGRLRIAAALEQNTQLRELHLDGPRDPVIAALLARNQKNCPDGDDAVPIDVARIKSVYRRTNPVA